MVLYKLGMVKENYKIIDNFLDKDSFKQIKETILGEDFQWFLCNSVAKENQKEKHNSFYFVHLIYRNNTVNSSLFKLMSPLLDKLNAKALIRIKANLYPNQNKFITHNSHKDYPYEHKGAILYVNNNNGYTVLNNKVKIESIENRVLLFNPSKSHSSTTCTDEKYRVNINFNFF